MFYWHFLQIYNLIKSNNNNNKHLYDIYSYMHFSAHVDYFILNIILMEFIPLY
jgi:hypothetical protein